MAETTKKPWEMNWSSLPQEAVTTANRGAENPKPWDMSWSALPPKEEALRGMSIKQAERAVRSTDASTVATAHSAFYRPTKFDKVFENLIQAESRGRHRTGGRLTTSPVGAKGITQVMPKTGIAPGYGVQPLQNDSEQEYRRFGRDYLSAMINEFGGDFRKAVAAYNAGPGNVKKAITKAEKEGGDWVQYLPKKSETIPYMKEILGEEF